MSPARLRPGTRARQAVGRQDRHHQRQQGGVVQRLHPGARHRLDDRRRQLQRAPRSPSTARPSADATSARRTARPSPGRCGRWPCARSRTSCPTRTFTPPSGAPATARSRSTSPTSTGMSTRRAAQMLAGAGFYVSHRRPPALQRARGHASPRPARRSASRHRAARRSTSTRRRADRAGSAQLAAYGGRDHATVGATLGLRRQHAHHPTHRPHAVVADAELVDRLRRPGRRSPRRVSCSGR